MVIIRKSKDVSFAVDGSILCNEAVIYLIECVLYFLEINRVILMGLDVDNLQQRSTDFAQSLDSFGLHAGVRLRDQLIFFTEEDLAIPHNIGEVFGSGRSVLILCIAFFRFVRLDFFIRLCGKTGIQGVNRLGKMLVQVKIFRGNTGRPIFVAVHISAAHHLAHEHFGIIFEIAVIGDPFTAVQVSFNPGRKIHAIKFYGLRSLFQENNIRCYIGSRQSLERCVG